MLRDKVTKVCKHHRSTRQLENPQYTPKKHSGYSEKQPSDVLGIQDIGIVTMEANFTTTHPGTKSGSNEN